jgi:hypothetical protein
MWKYIEPTKNELKQYLKVGEPKWKYGWFENDKLGLKVSSELFHTPDVLLKMVKQRKKEMKKEK